MGEDWLIWEDRLKERLRSERIERANKQHMSWELSRLCSNFLRENAKIWKERELIAGEEKERKKKT